MGIAVISPAQTFTTLLNFNGVNGSGPYYGSLVQGADGNFYGTTLHGGSNDGGTVFKVSPGGMLTTLYSFAQGSWEGLVQGADGNFYGTTPGGGANNVGTVFKISAGGTLTTLYNFTVGAGGDGPKSALVRATDGNFYGTTTGGGANGYGTIFEITPAGALSTLYSFTTVTEASDPGYWLVQATDGNSYGTSSGGGANSKGTIFKITAGGIFTVLHSFTGGDDGYAPLGGLVQATDGNLYGTTASGGSANEAGTVFKITTGGTLTTLYKFTGNADGAGPSGLIEATDGNFYGTTLLGEPVSTALFSKSLQAGP